MLELLAGWIVLSGVVTPIIGLALNRLESVPHLEHGATDTERPRKAAEDEITAAPKIKMGTLQIAQNCS